MYLLQAAYKTERPAFTFGYEDFLIVCGKNNQFDNVRISRQKPPTSPSKISRICCRLPFLPYRHRYASYFPGNWIDLFIILLVTSIFRDSRRKMMNRIRRSRVTPRVLVPVCIILFLHNVIKKLPILMKPGPLYP